MRNIGFFASLGFITTAASASAADLPTHKAAPEFPVIASYDNWTGGYVGAFGAYSWADPAGGYSISSASLAALPPIIPVIDAAGSQRLFMSGPAIGVNAGYNWRLSGLFVAGVEGDLEWNGLSGSHAINGTVPNFNIPFTIHQGMRINWEASARARLGVTPMDSLLLYVTGGVKIAKLNYGTSYWDPVPEIESKSISAVRGGWVVGAGAEWALSRNWSIRSEYLYSRISAATGTGSGLLADGTTAFIAHSTGTISENTVRLGLNYRF